MNKKLLSLALALALCLGLAVPAFAADAGTSAQLYTYISKDFPEILSEDLVYQVRTLNADYTYDKAADWHDTLTAVVPTSEYYCVGVYDLAKDEENDIYVLAFTDDDGDGVYDQRLFQAQLDKNTATVLPLPGDGKYEPTGPVATTVAATQLPGFDKMEDGDYAFSAASLHEMFGDNTVVFFTLPEREKNLGSVLLSEGAFDDVPGIGWYSHTVAWAAEKKITTGADGNDFAPGVPCTHIQILTFLSRAAGNTKAGSTGWAEEQKAVIQWAQEKGMIDDSFDAQKPCTRAEAVNYIWQAFDKPSATPSTFKDMDGYEQYAKAVDWAYEKEITRGSGDGIFDPGSVCNRAYIVTFLYRAYNQTT